MKRTTRQDSPYKVDHEPEAAPEPPRPVFDPVPLAKNETFRVERWSGKVRISIKEPAYHSEFHMSFDPIHAPAVARAVLLAGGYVERDSQVTISTDREDLVGLLKQEAEQYDALTAKRDELARVASYGSYAEAPTFLKNLIDHSIEKGI